MWAVSRYPHNQSTSPHAGGYSQYVRLLSASGAQELQLMVECVEPLTACTVVSDGGAVGWGTISMLLQACPYSALVEFSTHHSRTLLTLAERSLEAALAAGGGSGGSSSGGGVGRGGPSTGRPVLAEQQLAAAVRIGSCLALCWNGGMSGGAFGAASDTYEAKGGLLSQPSRQASRQASEHRLLAWPLRAAGQPTRQAVYYL
jgi:hypothetical protein